MNLLLLRVSVLFCSSVFLTCASDIPCNRKFGIDISEGKLLETGEILKDGVKYTPKNYVEENGFKIGCICDIKPCLRKCCPIGEYLKNKTCQRTRTPFIIPETVGPTLQTFYIITGNNCDPKKRRELLAADLRNRLGEFVVKEDGTLYLPPEEKYYSQLDSCVDYIDKVDEIKALICVDKVHFSANVIGMIISMPFLLATFVVYALLPERNLHGKFLMCYVITLFLAYLLLVVIQLYPAYLDDTICIIVGISCLFFFMVSFFLMNVMSIDIWWTFSGLRGFSGTRKEKERKRFLLYTGYAWGVPLLLVIVVTSLTLDTNIPFDAWYNPGIAIGQCWFTEGMAKLLYFYGPVAILIMANLIMFIITAYKIKRVQQDAAVFKQEESKKHNYEKDKQKFNLFLKLMLAMGINWSMEIISYAVDWQIVQVPQYVWYFTDFLNAVYGVFIFFIFVFKRNIWNQLKKRYYIIMGEPKEPNLAKTIVLVNYSPATNETSPNSKVKVNNDVNEGPGVLTS